MKTKRVLVLHGYSSANRGDGLLVDESLRFIRQACGDNVEIELVTSYPESFRYTGLRTFRSKPAVTGYSRSYLRLLATRFREYDLVVGVGGGYLRFGTLGETLKTILVMGPQLLGAAFSGARTVYLPQSIGPARYGVRGMLKALLERMDQVWVRDDRSLDQFSGKHVQRAPDLALLALKRSTVDFDKSALPVISVREHRGGVPPAVTLLAKRFGVFDGYVQSVVAGNDDSEAVRSLNPTNILSFEELMERPRSARVVVAVRLHAALMAINAGHYVIHLAYERKGFGAFQDLGLEDYVVNVHDFSVDDVEQKVRMLLASPETRRDYVLRVEQAQLQLQHGRARVLASLSSEAFE
ncbi:polysaccharide pyruvyl transferase family protein [Pseudarthrobacter sp. J75]|nr:polysaccharide pyruvyl transferase family protein [Pseudarthrobacter sp. J75]MEE2528232.1 polysaccharide pyruvyl transferase family protein [Pseudarthrobacter sp. J75]